MSKKNLFNFLKKQGIQIFSEQTPISTKSQLNIGFEGNPHYPVCLDNVIHNIRNIIEQKPSQAVYMADCTVGTGAHTASLLKAFNNLYILGIDQDKEMLNLIENNIIPNIQQEQAARLFLDQSNFREIHKYDLRKCFLDQNLKPNTKFDIIFADLGYNSIQLDDDQRGFAYTANGILDMRYNKKSNLATAADILNKASDIQLLEIFRNYGEEPQSQRYVDLIIKERQINQFKTADQLRQLILNNTKIEPYKSLQRIFQALRIAVNDEIHSLVDFMGHSFESLAPGGLFMCISFHSLERDIVEANIRKMKSLGVVKILQKRAKPTEEELKINKRSHSAEYFAYLKKIK